MKELLRQRRGALALVSAILVTAATGCGGDDDDDRAPAAARPEFTGEPVTVYYMAPLKSKLADFSDGAAAARAAADAINADGGLGRRELVVKTCNDTDANAEVACVREAARAGAVAFVGTTFIFNPQASLKVLADNGIPNIAAQVSHQVEFGSPTAFPIYAPALGIIACPEQVTDATEAQRVAGIAQDLPLQRELLQTVEGIAKATGVDYGGNVTTPVTQTDFAPTVQELADTDAQAVVNVLAPTAQTPFFTALRSVGADFTAYCSGPTLYTIQILEQLGEQANSVYISSGLPAVSEEAARSYPLIQRFREEMEASADAGNEDAAPDEAINLTVALNAWLGVQILKQVSGDVKGELTSKRLLAALNDARVELGEPVPPLDFSKPAPAPGLERVFNPIMRLYRWDAAEQTLVETDAKPVNVLELFAALQKAGSGQN